MQLVDIGVNLTNKSLLSQINQVISDAKTAGIIHQIITGTSTEESILALEIAKTDINYFSTTAGCHPHDAKDFTNNDIAVLKKLATHSSVVAIGECGLDFNRNFSPPKSQEEVFIKQIELACELQKPLFMHQRDAHMRFIDLISDYKKQLPSGVVHCFTGDKNEMQDYLDLGFYIGITGWICDLRRNQELVDAVKYLPPDRLLIETDAPYLLPRNIAPKPTSRTNTPSNLTWIVDTLAEILSKSASLIAEETTNNARNLFHLTI